MELARKISVPLVLVTIVSRKYSQREKKAFHHAYTQAHAAYTLQAGNILPESSINTQHICLEAEGLCPIDEFAPKLAAFAAQKTDAILVLPPDLFSTADQAQLIDSSYSAILLPQGIDQTVTPASEKFYDVFRSSHHVRMHRKVLHELSKDRALFNYFTSVFGRKH